MMAIVPEDDVYPPASMIVIIDRYLWVSELQCSNYLS